MHQILSVSKNKWSGWEGGKEGRRQGRNVAGVFGTKVIERSGVGHVSNRRGRLKEGGIVQEG
jgi:hypothetical protein